MFVSSSATGSDPFVVSSHCGSCSSEQHQNFEESQEAMKQQLLQLSILLKALDPELCDFLGQWDHTDLLLAVKLTA